MCIVAWLYHYFVYIVVSLYHLYALLMLLLVLELRHLGYWLRSKLTPFTCVDGITCVPCILLLIYITSFLRGF